LISLIDYWKKGLTAMGALVYERNPEMAAGAVCIRFTDNSLHGSSS
jgi:hypothetical protein